MNATLTTPVDAKIRSEVEAVLAEMYAAWTARDAARVVALFANAPDLVLWGSDDWESILGIENARVEFKRWTHSCPPWTGIGPEKRTYHQVGDMAWAADEVRGDWRAGMRSGFGLYRMTTILERSAAGWKVVHANVSIPDRT